MKNARLLTYTMLATVLGLSTSAWAVPDCDAQNATNFRPIGAEGQWTDPANWFPEGSGPPDSTKIACIDPGKTARIIDNEFEHAKELYIKTLGTVLVWGDLEGMGAASVTLYDNSTIDGKLLVAASTLKINGPITLDGTGKVAISGEFGETNMARIDGVLGSGAVLTLVGEHAGSWTPDQWDYWKDNDTLVLMGGGEINVALVNQAHVSTIEEDGFSPSPPFGSDRELTINATAISGDGFWIAEINPDNPREDIGILNIQDAVGGSATWVVASGDAEIRINYPLTVLTGGVIIESGGLLEVNQNFDTTGDLISNKGKIKVASGKQAAFD